MNKERVTEILYSVEASTTNTIHSLFSLNNGSIVETKITGEKVNVRSAPDRIGKMLFQVSRSKGDKLIVNGEGEVGWHSVSYLILLLILLYSSIAHTAPAVNEFKASMLAIVDKNVNI